MYVALAFAFLVGLGAARMVAKRPFDAPSRKGDGIALLSYTFTGIAVPVIVMRLWDWPAPQELWEYLLLTVQCYCAWTTPILAVYLWQVVRYIRAA